MLPDSKPRNIRKPLWTKKPITMIHLAIFLLKNEGFIIYPIDKTEDTKYKIIEIINGI